MPVHDFPSGLCRAPEGMSVSLGRRRRPACSIRSHWFAPDATTSRKELFYRLKITNVPSRPGVELYPTLEVGPVMPRTEAFLAHNAIPAQFTEEDFDQVLTAIL